MEQGKKETPFGSRSITHMLFIHRDVELNVNKYGNWKIRKVKGCYTAIPIPSSIIFWRYSTLLHVPTHHSDKSKYQNEVVSPQIKHKLMTTICGGGFDDEIGVSSPNISYQV
jgi:hypothetical protein